MPRAMYENNFFKEQPWEASGAEAIGITVSMFRFLLSFFASVAVGAVFRFVPSITGRLIVLYGIASRNSASEWCSYVSIQSLQTSLTLLYIMIVVANLDFYFTTYFLQ